MPRPKTYNRPYPNGVAMFEAGGGKKLIQFAGFSDDPEYPIIAFDVDGNERFYERDELVPLTFAAKDVLKMPVSYPWLAATDDVAIPKPSDDFHFPTDRDAQIPDSCEQRS
ncbi:MAG: hypothetical protein ABI445_11675 [Polyangia bacterium]